MEFNDKNDFQEILRHPPLNGIGRGSRWDGFLWMLLVSDDTGQGEV